MAALPPAGVNLQAQGFNEYIKRLGKVENLQQAIFDIDGRKVTVAFDKASNSAKKYGRNLGEAEKNTKRLGAITVSAGNLASGAINQLVGSIINLGNVTARAFSQIVADGVKLNQQFELTEKVFTNVFGDPQLGKATVNFLNETADQLRVGRKEAAAFAQSILPRTGGLDEFTELLRLTDIQADTTGQSLGELEFSIREALSGDFVSLKDRFDLGTEQINRIKELTPELGRSQALITVLTNEFERLGKTDISGTLGANIKDLQSTFIGLQATLGKPTFDILREQSENLLASLDRNEKGLQRTAIALGEVVGNAVELVSVELVEFIDNLDFTAIEVGINNLNAFVEALRVVAKTVKVAFETGVIQTAFGIINRDTDLLISGFAKLKNADFGQAFRDIRSAVDQARERQEAYITKVNETANAQSSLTDGSKAAIDAFLAQSAAQSQAAQSLESYSNILKQAESLQLSFARAAEDTALKLARANEDVARRQGRQVAKLGERQAKDRDKLLKNQQKQLDKFEDNRRKQIAKAESNIRKARKEANEQRKRDQQRLQRELARAQERFNLSQLQSERRFALSERRLRAEGDILALQELREDFALQQQEEKENFNLSKKETVQSAREQEKEQERGLENRLNELKTSLENQRAELLQSFDEQLIAQQDAQIEARQQQQIGFEEQAADRQIALAREEEDRKISQARQLEDLGISLANQKNVTEEGSLAVAKEIEKIFGVEGVADSIFGGFKKRTESDFKELFDNLEDIVQDTKIEPPKPKPLPAPIPLPGAPRLGGEVEFQEGGIVPGPIGSSQLIRAHGGETILPTHQTGATGQFYRQALKQAVFARSGLQTESFQMPAPVVPSQTLSVEMTGGFDIRGSENISREASQAAIEEITQSFEIAIERLARRN